MVSQTLKHGVCRIRSASLDAAPVRLLALDNVLAAALEPGLSDAERQSRQQRKVRAQTCARLPRASSLPWVRHSIGSWSYLCGH